MTKPKLSEPEPEPEPEDNVSSEEGTDNAADGNDVPINHEKITDYEKQRLHRIAENKKRMEALGLPKMAISFMGSVPKAQKKSNDKKGKKKIDIDEEYNPTQEDEEMSCSDDEDDNDDEFSPSKKTKMKKNSSTPKKRGPVQKPTFDSDFVDDDDALMQAISLSLQDTETSGANLMNPAPSANDKRKETLAVKDGLAKKTRRKLQATSRVHMNEDEMLIHFFQFDESGKGGLTLRDVQRLAAAHDFTWSEREMADMIYCFDSDGDGKISFDDFRKIVVRCNMLKESGNDATG